jgi:hypothetical protein
VESSRGLDTCAFGLTPRHIEYTSASVAPLGLQRSCVQHDNAFPLTERVEQLERHGQVRVRPMSSCVIRAQPSLAEDLDGEAEPVRDDCLRQGRSASRCSA